MSRNLGIFGWGLALALSASLGLGCAQIPVLATLKGDPVQLDAWGPGTVFQTVDEAAIDALTYAYLQAREAHDTECVRGGTIYRVDQGYSYGEVHVAGPMAAYRVSYTLGPQDVARFAIYPKTGRYEVDRGNERPSRADRRSVSVVDPLHRPLFILHPSLVIRQYQGEGHEITAVADLRHPEQMQQFARQPCEACMASH